MLKRLCYGLLVIGGLTGCSINQLGVAQKQVSASISSSVAQNSTSNNPNPTIFIGGDNVSAFQYAVTSDPAQCSEPSIYNSGYMQSNKTISLSLASVPYGTIAICAIGTDKNGQQQSVKSPTVYSWTYAQDPIVTLDSVKTSLSGETLAITVKLRLPYPSYQDSSFSYEQIDSNVAVPNCPLQTTDGSCFTAIAGQDFIASAGHVVIPAGETSSQVVILVPNSANHGSTLGLNLFLGIGDQGVSVSNTIIPLVVP